VQLAAEVAEVAVAAVESGGVQASEAVGCGRAVGGLWFANGASARPLARANEVIE
jgi:hypothetical protein